MSLSFIYLELILWFVTYKPVVQGILQRGTTFYIWLCHVRRLGFPLWYSNKGDVALIA